MTASLLEKISGPGDLKVLSVSQLQQLAAEAREYMIQVVSRNGGHLASSLGVVELTLAIHTVYDSSRDRVIWDVGHQTYLHKMLTGRRKVFDTLRQIGGISGFPKREESPHDAFNTGHASTSISAAVGFALGRDLTGEKYAVVAVVGDGALTGGMAYEGLNNAGRLNSNITVILNDNEMSIAPNVGAMASYLARLRTAARYGEGKKKLERAMRHFPAGGSMLRFAGRIKASMKYLLVPGMVFEELGFTYLGPIDGHNIEELVTVLTRARKLDGPVLVHVKTKKGRGYLPAENNPDTFHGIGPFDVESGKKKAVGGPVSYTEVFGRTMVAIGAEDPRVVAITAAMADGTGLKDFGHSYPRRLLDVGIAEEHAVTMAAGMAAAGLRPVVAIYSTFLQRAYDQIFHDVCLMKLPVIFALDRAGIVGEDGETHHGLYDIAYLRHLPGMVVMAPKDEGELPAMLRTAIALSCPVAIRYPRGMGRGVSVVYDAPTMPLGKAEVLRGGDDVSILAIGSMVPAALETADILSARGVEATVVNARFTKPLDADLIRGQARKAGWLVTIEEHSLAGGFGSAVLEFLADAGIVVPVTRFGVPDRIVSHGRPEKLFHDLGLTAQEMAERIIGLRKGIKVVAGNY